MKVVLTILAVVAFSGVALAHTLNPQTTGVLGGLQSTISTNDLQPAAQPIIGGTELQQQPHNIGAFIQ